MNPFFQATLAAETNDRPALGLLAIVVILLHLLLVLRLLSPNDVNKKEPPIKVVEVVIVPPPPPEPPKEKAAPPAPAPAKPVIPKVVTPKKPPPKKPVKPVVKKDTFAPKKVERIKPEPKAEDSAPVFPSPVRPIAKPSPFTVPSLKPATKPVAKPGRGDERSTGVNSNAVPLARVTPVYPMRAKSRNIEGWVKISLTVSASGAVTNPRVVGASPSGIFDDAAMDAIRRMRFKPKLVNGKPVTSTAVQTFRFSLNR